MGSDASAVHRTAVLVAVVMSAFLTPFVGSSVNVALPAIGQEFHMSAVALSWVATAFLLSAAALLVPVGRLADIYGRRRLFLWGVLVHTVASLASVVAPFGGVLIGLRALQGLGSALIFATGIAILTSVFPGPERGRALGYHVASVYTGLAVGPLVGGLLTQVWGWRAIFLAPIPVGLGAAALIGWRLRDDWTEAPGEPFDVFGALLYAGSLTAFMYGLSRLPGTDGVGIVLLGLSGLAAFGLWESQNASPLLDVRLLGANRAFLFSNLAALIHYTATFAVVFLMSLYLQGVKGLPPAYAGALLVTQPVLQALFSPWAGRLSDRVAPGVIASVGMSLSAAGLFLLAWLGPTTPMAWVLSGLGLLGSGFGLFSAPNTNAIMQAVERRHYGVASGTLGTMRLVGQALSMGVVTLLLALYMGPARLSPEHVPHFMEALRSAFLVFTGLCILGIGVSLARGGKGRWAG
ncbi:MAG: MFS transporter [Acidobacteria bacterium]|nr:MFS transporter [Acidobacteriota bacterium]MDW7984701.1 MFS transporter [Acidobacteriota bacterium]